MWLDQKLIHICGRLGFPNYTLKLTGPCSYIYNFYDPKTIGYFAHLTVRYRVQSHFCCIVMNLS